MNITDPRYIGPGIWILFHSRSYRANTKENIQKCIDFIVDTCENFPCEHCREHAIKYITEYPPSKFSSYIHAENDIGLFMWTVIFHNAVNARLKKNIMSIVKAIELYSSLGDSCDTACTESG